MPEDPTLEASIATVCGILEGMGLEDVGPDAVVTAPPFYDADTLLKGPDRFNRFNGQLAFQLRFTGYPIEEVAFLSVRELCEMYLRDSYPPIPTEPLSDEQYEFSERTVGTARSGTPKEFPICFVLGAPRSGTTLFRAMLDLHPRLWAPGELTLANFDTLGERASHVAPFLRYIPIPELATRQRESIASFSRTFRAWEQRNTPVTDVFEHLYRADPDALIVDKTPGYCAQLDTLERIGEQFPNAKFIHLIRSPHDVIRSFVRLQLHRGNRTRFESSRNPYQNAEAIWYASNSNSEAFLNHIPAHRKAVVRYEDLVADPATSLARVCDLLGRTYDPRMADPYANASGPIARGAGDLHIHLLKRVEKREAGEAFYTLGRRCQRLVEAYGY